MPLTLLQLRESHRYAVIEMGMNHAGEIATSRASRSRRRGRQQCRRAHVEKLGSVEAIAHAKGEIIAVSSRAASQSSTRTTMRPSGARSPAATPL